MGTVKKLRHEFKSLNSEKTSACHLYLLKVGKVHYFGFEDIGEGISISEAITDLCQSILKDYDLPLEDAFFFKWYTNNMEKGVEWIEFQQDDNHLHSPSIKKYCKYHQNPFF